MLADKSTDLYIRTPWANADEALSQINKVSSISYVILKMYACPWFVLQIAAHWLNCFVKFVFNLWRLVMYHRVEYLISYIIFSRLNGLGNNWSDFCHSSFFIYTSSHAGCPLVYYSLLTFFWWYNLLPSLMIQPFTFFDNANSFAFVFIVTP